MHRSSTASADGIEPFLLCSCCAFSAPAPPRAGRKLVAGSSIGGIKETQVGGSLAGWVGGWLTVCLDKWAEGGVDGWRLWRWCD